MAFRGARILDEAFRRQEREEAVEQYLTSGGCTAKSGLQGMAISYEVCKLRVRHLSASSLSSSEFFQAASRAKSSSQ